MKSNKPYRQSRRQHLKKLSLLSCLFGLCTFGESEPAQETKGENKTIDLAKALAQIKPHWESGRIASVMILYIPTAMDFPVNMYPFRFDKAAVFKLIVNEPKNKKSRKNFTEPLGGLLRVLRKKLPMRAGGLFF